ncbi:DUF3370 domain-containing protein [Candidatus Cyanaurora vandensis]|uniref:DUF3370 domain-containing protein n=1 Tax=Candidatus Cyanaurora vandensis TaxID=2714958 RepID=UPI00257AA0C4|nr:DUF3370 domain-containing protein [Candidatus Cyanaurora vandensis]
MLPLWPLLLLAQAQTPPVGILELQSVRALPGRLDQIPTFNSNSPELVTGNGILLSTFPPSYGQNPQAHLDFALKGRFDLFAHHIAKTPDGRTLYLGLLLHNPGLQPVTVDILQAASHLTQPDAPFLDLPPLVDNLLGNVFAGPGSRVTNDILRNVRQADWPGQVILAPRTSQMLTVLPIYGYNGRSTLARLRSSGPIYAASLALVAPTDFTGQEFLPTLTDWENLLTTGTLAAPRDLAPTPPGSTGNFIYGRVAGVALGSRWQAELSDSPQARFLTIPTPGSAISYVLSTASFGTLGTQQVQSAPMQVRYPDTAYLAHGNYGIEYNLSFTLANSTAQPQTVTLSLQSPRKPLQDVPENALRFSDPPDNQVTFRGTVRVRYNDEADLPQTRYAHLVLRRGQQGSPLFTLILPATSQRLVYVDYLYPPDSTPPQVLTLRTSAP